jgi:hypothetical protein
MADRCLASVAVSIALGAFGMVAVTLPATAQTNHEALQINLRVPKNSYGACDPWQHHHCLRRPAQLKARRSSRARHDS